MTLQEYENTYGIITDESIVSDFRDYITGIMSAMETNLAIVELQVVINNDPICVNGNYKLFVTKDKETKELKFFSLNGIQHTWLSNDSRSEMRDIKLIRIRNISEYKEIIEV